MRARGLANAHLTSGLYTAGLPLGTRPCAESGSTVLHAERCRNFLLNVVPRSERSIEVFFEFSGCFHEQVESSSVRPPCLPDCFHNMIHPKKRMRLEFDSQQCSPHAKGQGLEQVGKQYATQEDVDRFWQSPIAKDPPPKVRQANGPGHLFYDPELGLQEEYQNRAGAHTIIQSSHFDAFESGLLQAAESIIPEEVRSREGDTCEALVARILDTGFYDDLEALQGGGQKGKRRVHTNATDYSTPRRKSWSVVVKDCHADESGKLVRTMYKYGKENSRIRTVCDATPMPMPVFELGARCFMSVRDKLAEVCKQSPPNHCQVLGYYGLFDPKMGRHKDDHKIEAFKHFLVECQLLKNEGRLDDSTKAELLEAGANTSKGAMVPGSDVIIFSVGPLPMQLHFLFPPKATCTLVVKTT